LFSTTFIPQTKEVIKEQSRIFSLAYSVTIDSTDLRGGEKRVCIIFTNFFLNSSLRNTWKRAMFHYKEKQNKQRIKTNFRPASGLQK